MFSAVLTSIDPDGEHQRLARQSLGEAGVPSGRVRLIAGRALDAGQPLARELEQGDVGQRRGARVLERSEPRVDGAEQDEQFQFAVGGGSQGGEPVVIRVARRHAHRECADHVAAPQRRKHGGSGAPVEDGLQRRNRGLG